MVCGLRGHTAIPGCRIIQAGKWSLGCVVRKTRPLCRPFLQRRVGHVGIVPAAIDCLLLCGVELGLDERIQPILGTEVLRYGQPVGTRL